MNKQVTTQGPWTTTKKRYRSNLWSPRRFDLRRPDTTVVNAASYLFFLSCVLLFCTSAYASDISLHGFMQGNYSAGVAASNPQGGDFKLAEERLQLKLDATADPFHLFIKADGWYDHIGQKWGSELREGYIDYTAGKWDARLGRQVITWGVGDLVFINDVFPKDYEAFFSGRPLEYLKKGVDGAKIGLYPGFASFELVAIPLFTPNHFPDSQRFWMFDPLSGNGPGITNRETVKPAATIENTEIALRAYRDIAGFDASLYYYRGFFRQPSMLPDNMTMPTKLTLSYPKLSVYGASLQGKALDGVLSLEAGHYDSRQDRNGTDPMVPNSQTRFLLCYQRQLWEDFTVSFQYYAAYMHDYRPYMKNLPSGFPQERHLHDLVSIRLTQFLMHQTLRLSWFSFWGPSDSDYLLNPEIKYNFSDHVWAALGGMVFGGDKSWSQFGQLDKNDNVYLQVRYEF
ncbi:MAG: hypothetical protein HZB33_15760 [Nitrospirae bacterium]|nr:hypothetical protein [Nitrospirota bacterium]